MAPPRWLPSLATMPTGAPSMRARAVAIPFPKLPRSSGQVPGSGVTV
ncbi:hypothetical protein ACFFX0_30580 [Citricoccus parietis]|uniref:Uncharacterized protein n=1 Tax=Citricoccus parietis TaxID=592307 RepID=A0ABV5G9Z4_9MICC